MIALFFGSTTAFTEKIDITNNPKNVIIDFKKGKISDMSAKKCVNKLTDRYLKAGKIVQLRHLSADCRALLKNAGKVIEVNIMEDPTYKLALD